MQKKSEMFKKRNSSGQALNFLPPRKPRLYISRVDFFFFEHHKKVIKIYQFIQYLNSYLLQNLYYGFNLNRINKMAVNKKAKK